MATWTTYQGVEVLDSDDKVEYQHPRWGRLGKTLTGATLLALADGAYVVVCNECGYNGLTGRKPYVKPEEGEQKPIINQADSLFAHINGIHNPNKTDRSGPPRPKKVVSPRYTDAQIKVAIKIWLKWRATRISNWSQSACDELENLGFKPNFAEKWNPDQLGKLVRTHMGRDLFKNIKAGALSDADQEALAEMVRDAAERAQESGRPTVARSARITTRVRKVPSRTVSPAPWTEDDEVSETIQKKEEAVAATEGPKLSFSGRGGDQSSTMKLTMNADGSSETKVEDQAAPPEKEENLYTHVTEQDGCPVFVYGKRKVLMVGKPVREFRT